MKIKGIIDEDFVNYKKICMTIEMPICKDFKCNKDCGHIVCHNVELASAPTFDISIPDLISIYLSNRITEAICFQGLEPFDSFLPLWTFIDEFRKVCRAFK